MYRYKHLLVGLRLDGYDDTLIRYAKFVSELAASDRVRFVHVLPAAAAFREVYVEYHGSVDGAAARIQEELDTAVGQGFEAPGHTGVQCEIIEGAPLTELLRTAKDDDTDLMVLGKDQEDSTLSEKLARKAPCSVLIVPPKAPARIERVLVAVDFSDHSADAVDVAVAFAQAAGLEEIHLLHVYDVPTSYLKLGMSYEEFEGLRRRFAEERYDPFVNQLDLRGLTLVPHFTTARNVPEAIHEQARDLDADLIVLGSRGRTASSAVLLGSVAERMVRTAEVPTVSVKRKGSTLRLLDALLEL